MYEDWSEWFLLLVKKDIIVEKYAAELPDDTSPCCYQLGVGLKRHNARIEPVYVGKAKHFKNRMYHHIGNHSRTRHFINEIEDGSALFCRYTDVYEDYANLERILLRHIYPWNKKSNNQYQYRNHLYIVECDDKCGWHEFRNDRKRRVCPCCKCSEVDYDLNDIFVGSQYRAYCENCNFVEWRDDRRRIYCPECRSYIEYHKINCYEYE